MSDKARYRELGNARLAAARQAKSKEDWDRLWAEPAHPYTFKPGTCWNHCVEYKVEDFAAEVGFFIDILGFTPNAVSHEYAMFTSPSKEFFFSIVPVEQGKGTPADAIRLQFMIADIGKVAENLEKRGIEFEEKPIPQGEGSPMYKGTFRTPHGIPVDLWGMVEEKE